MFAINNVYGLLNLMLVWYLVNLRLQIYRTVWHVQNLDIYGILLGTREGGNSAKKIPDQNLISDIFIFWDLTLVCKI